LRHGLIDNRPRSLANRGRAFAPRLPAAWERLRFPVAIRGHRIEVDMTPVDTTYRLLAGTGLPVKHFDETLRLRPGEPVRRPVPGVAQEVARAA